MTRGGGGPAPTVLVTHGRDVPLYDGYAERLAASLASRRQRVLCISTEHVMFAPPGNGPGQPYAAAPYLWCVTAADPESWQYVKDAWEPDFDVLLVTGGNASWSIGWGQMASHSLFLFDSAEAGWERLVELPGSLPVGCLATSQGRPGRDAFDRIAEKAERAGRRPLQWLGAVPHERGDWCRRYERLLRRGAEPIDV